MSVRRKPPATPSGSELPAIKSPQSPAIESPAGRRALAGHLLNWYDGHARDLPWRQTRDLYAIWISEIMLQQTQVATVISYWRRFLARFPDVAALAAADEQEVLRLWEGLGYYRRARQLHAAARQIVQHHGGHFPRGYESVRALPGIGRYTAGAILSIGLDQRLPILEANTIRVFSRLVAFTGDPASTIGQKRLWKIAEEILPAERVGPFNQALMELGSEICTPRSPGCERCPVVSLCEARRRGLVDQIPLPAKKTRYEEVTEAAVVIRHRGRILVRHCQPGERWAGLWDFPRFSLPATSGRAIEPAPADITRAIQERLGMVIGPPRSLAIIKHGVTRFRITLHCYEARLARGAAQSTALRSAQRWLAPRDLADYPLSSTGRKISELLRT